MRRLALMENINMTNTTQITRVRFACPQAADRSLIGVDRGAFRGTGLSGLSGVRFGGTGVGNTTDIGTDRSAVVEPTFYAPMHKALAVKDVAYLRSWRPPV
jgi:hypothetical protein